MARTGKIARLPLSIREELNARLRDGEPASTLLPWVNKLLKVKAILAEHFGGVEISDANLTEWRQGGHQDFLKDQARVDNVRQLSEMSYRLAKAAGGNLSEGLMAVAAGKLQEALEAVGEMEVDADGKPTGDGLADLVKALGSVRKLEIDTINSGLKKKELEHKGEALALEKKKFQRTTAELFLKWYDDKTARDIAEGKGTKDTKVAELIQLWFGDMPEGIGPKELRKAKEGA